MDSKLLSTCALCCSVSEGPMGPAPVVRCGAVCLQQKVTGSNFGVKIVYFIIENNVSMFYL